MKTKTTTGTPQASQDVEVTIQMITPEDAAMLLQTNVNNRKLSRRRVEMYANDIKRGMWKLTGDTIKLAKNPKTGEVRLIDGQHRLHAIVSAGMPMQTVVATGLNEDAFSVIDRGKTRTYNDVLSMSNIKNSNTVASVLRPIIALDAGLNPYGNGMELVTPEDVVNYAQENDEMIQWAVNRSFKMRERVSGSGTAWAMFMYLLAQKHGVKMAEAFTESVLSGVGYREGDPRAALRNWILRNYTKHKGTSRAAYDMCAMVIRAYNYTVDGTKIVQMRSADNSGDNWPTISSKKFTA
jgi:hypothetical protein